MYSDVALSHLTSGGTIRVMAKLSSGVQGLLSPDAIFVPQCLKMPHGPHSSIPHHGSMGCYQKVIAAILIRQDRNLSCVFAHDGNWAQMTFLVKLALKAKSVRAMRASAMSR